MSEQSKLDLQAIVGYALHALDNWEALEDEALFEISFMVGSAIQAEEGRG